MIKKAYTITCSICGEELIKTNTIPPKNTGFAEFNIKFAGDELFGLLCENCAILICNRPIEKFKKVAVKQGNSSQIVLPKNCLGHSVVAYILKKEGEA
ncbi:MAG: zinc ribbon domain protein [Siphoviridae sp. ctjeG17]|nr:MAG: zinc ribbon domain protein [Siphoviridae sp. ctjeG17]